MAAASRDETCSMLFVVRCRSPPQMRMGLRRLRAPQPVTARFGASTPDPWDGNPCSDIECPHAGRPVDTASAHALAHALATACPRARAGWHALAYAPPHPTQTHTLADQSSLLRWMLFVLVRYISFQCSSFGVSLDLVSPVPQGAHWLIRRQVHKTDQVLLPNCIHSFVECGRMQVPHSPAS